MCRFGDACLLQRNPAFVLVCRLSAGSRLHSYCPDCREDHNLMSIAKTVQRELTFDTPPVVIARQQSDEPQRNYFVIEKTMERVN